MNNKLTTLAIIATLALSSCTRYQGTTSLILDDLGIHYEVVDHLAHGRHGEYDSVMDTIRILRGSGDQGVMLHELMHKVRRDVKLDVRTEEIVACIAAFRLSKASGIRIGVSKYSLKDWISRCLTVNKEGPYNERERTSFIDAEVTKTLNLLSDMLEERGHSFKEIDWVKTAIVLLL